MDANRDLHSENRSFAAAAFTRLTCARVQYNTRLFGTPQSPKPADSKREEFRKYLEKSGVLDSLTKVLVTLYEEPEKPSSAVDFLKQHINGGPPDTADVESLKLDMAKLKERNTELEDEVASLRQKLEELDAKSEPDEKST